MCGIVGYIGKNDSVDIILKGLESLEYRGYDSAGVALVSENKIHIRKTKGKLENLKEKISLFPVSSTIGIGHTRWATHGAPSEKNSHPHTNEKGTIAVVHNGIIENYEKLKIMLIKKGYRFETDTDTEVIPHLIDMYYEGDLMKALKDTVKDLEGSYALAVISSLTPDKIIAVKKDSPLIVASGENGNYLASDIPAILSETRDIYLLDDKEYVTLTADNITITNESGEIIRKEIFNADFSMKESQKDGYSHYMLKEIHEQPEAVRRLLAKNLGNDMNLNMEYIEFSDNIKKIFIVACGTAYHAGLVGKKVIETIAKIPCEVCLASEFRYGEPLLNEQTTVIVVTQSGETADTLAALRMAKKLGNKIYAITNVAGSSVSREADYVFYTKAGPEISVASTKAYTTQLTAFYLFAIRLAQLRGSAPKKEMDDFTHQLLMVPEMIEKSLALEDKIKYIAEKISREKDIYFIGRGMDYFTAQEASLKLKELSYIHSDAYAGGELKHGPIALIEDKTIVVSVCTEPDISRKLISNVKEVTARGAFTIGFISSFLDSSAFNITVNLPSVYPLLSPISSIIPMQLLAYYVCISKGLDVDKPRNLAKSVTVE